MNKINKLYLSLGLLLSIGSQIYTYDEESQGHEIIKELTEQEKLDKTQQEIDQELYDVFGKFFDEKDTMPFAKIVSKVVAILKIKKTMLPEAQQIKCNEIIKSLEKNKYNSSFSVWARILISQDLKDLLSPETRAYIDSISIGVKIKSLRSKLDNNPHSFF